MENTTLWYCNKIHKNPNELDVIDLYVIKTLNTFASERPISTRYYMGYTLIKYKSPQTNQMVWDAINNETGKTDYQAKTVKDLIQQINNA